VSDVRLSAPSCVIANGSEEIPKEPTETPDGRRPRRRTNHSSLFQKSKVTVATSVCASRFVAAY